MSVYPSSTIGRTPRRVFIGDWPFIDRVALGCRAGGVGPAMTDDTCEACGKRIAKTGECGCSE